MCLQQKKGVCKFEAKTGLGLNGCSQRVFFLASFQNGGRVKKKKIIRDQEKKRRRKINDRKWKRKKRKKRKEKKNREMDGEGATLIRVFNWC